MTLHPVRNRWVDLDLPPLGGWTPTKTISVVVPGKNAQANLDRMLLALGHQTYPSELMEIVVVDDASDVPMTAPDHTGDVEVRLVRQESDGRFGAGRARNRGAVETNGEIIVFLDSDILAGTDVIERHARWHHLLPYIFLTGILTYVPVDHIDVERLNRLIRADELAALLRPTETFAQHYREETFSRTHDLAEEALDLFRIVIGGTMSLHRAFYDQIGGLRELGLRGIEDTEFGYRAQTAGALLVLDRESKHWHQGPRFFDSNAAKRAKRAREPLIRDLIPVPTFRPTPAKVAYRVPSLAVIVDASTGHAADVQATLASFRGAQPADVVLWVRGALDGMSLGDRMIAEASFPPIDRVATPFRLEVSPGVKLARDTPRLVLDRMRADLVGAIHFIDTTGDGAVLARAVSARADGRARFVANDARDVDEAIGRIFGERWLPAAAVGLSR